jgi:hypothetical protein
VLVAVVSPTVERLTAIHSSAYGPKGSAPAAGSTHRPVSDSASETFSQRSASALRAKLFECWRPVRSPVTGPPRSRTIDALDASHVVAQSVSRMCHKTSQTRGRKAQTSWSEVRPEFRVLPQLSPGF